MSRIVSVVPSGRPAARPALFAALFVALSATAPAALAQDTTAAAKPVPAPSTPASTLSVPAASPARSDTAAKVVAPAPAVPKESAAAVATPGTVAPKQSVPVAASGAVAAKPAPTTASTVTPAGTPAPVEAPADDLANAYVQRAVSLYEMGKDEAALAEYRRGIAADPLDSDTWFGLADLLHELGRDKQAIETYTLALSTIEHAPELRLPFAELLIANQRKAEAIKVLQRGIEIDPLASADLKEMLGKVLYGVLGDSANPVAAPAADSAKKAPVAKAKPKTVRKKHKKLCNLFCPGSLDAVAPKP